MIYTATPLTGKAIQSPAFQKKGIEGLTAGRLTQLYHVGVTVEKQLAYDGYMSNLPAFLHATSVQKKVTANQIWYKSTLSNDLTVPLPLPPLCILRNTPYKNDEEKSAFRASLGAIELEETRGIKGTFYILRKPTLDLISTLPLTTIDPNAPSPQDATSLGGLLSFVQTIKTISLFLAVHSYPYKQTPEDDGTTTQEGSVFAWLKGKNFLPHNGNRFQDPTPDLLTGSVDLDEASIMEEDPTPLASGSIASGRGAVLVAKPAPLRPSINFGVPSAIPNLPGYVLPYFRGLIEPSKETIISVYRRFFMGTLAKDKESSTHQWYTWMRGVDKWYQTEAGRIVTHILFNIQTALEAQARLFLIIRNGEYLGCAILGYGFAININGLLAPPEIASRVRTEVMELDGHSRALEEIRELLEGGEGSDRMTDVLDLSSTRRVYKAINAAPKMEGEDLERLKEAVSKLSFDETFLGPHVEHICKVLKNLTIDEKESCEDWPMYLDPSLLYDTSRAHQLFAAFGPTAPSFVDSAGTDFAIPKGLLDADPLSEVDTVTAKRAMDTILISMKRLPQAVGDWTNVVKKRRIRQNVLERAAGFRTIQFRGRARDDVWRALKQIPFKETGVKRKRGAEDEDGAEGSSKKRGDNGTKKTADLDFSDFL